jgi:uncharacterized Rossmann fold enzyme
MAAEPRVLALGEKQSVQYCVPHWLRDEQIRQNIARVPGRIQHGDRRDAPVAVVCFGPSLNDTWEQVKSFEFVITCSGAHQFLVNRGIVPTWHVEVDPRAHKVGLIGAPQRATEYLLASTCHPSVVDHLAGYNVKLWHVFDNSEEGLRTLPSGEWAITGGCDVGLRALTIAGFLGFRDVHVFGMDQSAGTVDAPRNTRHAAAHPHSGKKYDLVDVDGVRYFTTPAMLEAARQLAHELDQMPAVTATFHGEGLVQHLMRSYVPKLAAAPHPLLGTIAASKPPLISAEYVALNAQLHRENLAYGVGGGKHADTVRKLRDRIKAESVLDYGAGKGYLAKALDFPIWQYDPAIPEIAESPRPADLVVCTDVLEHIEPECLTFVLSDLKRCVRRVGYFVIHMGPAAKRLADGRNAHLIQRGERWWRKRLAKFFEVGSLQKRGIELYVVVGPKAAQKGRAA